MAKTVQDLINEKAKKKLDRELRVLLNPFVSTLLIREYYNFPHRFLIHLQEQVRKSNSKPVSLFDMFYNAMMDSNLSDYIDEESKNFVEGRKDGT